MQIPTYMLHCDLHTYIYMYDNLWHNIALSSIYLRYIYNFLHLQMIAFLSLKFSTKMVTDNKIYKQKNYELVVK